MNKSVPTVFVTRHGARIAMSGAEAEELRSRGIVSRPDPGQAPAVYHPEGGRGLDEVGAALALLRAGPAGFPVLFEAAYVLAVSRGGRTLYLDGEGGFTDEPDAALEFTPEGKLAHEAGGSFGVHEGAEWQERLGDRITPLPEPADSPPAPTPDSAHPARGREQVEALKRAWRDQARLARGSVPGPRGHAGLRGASRRTRRLPGRGGRA